MPDPPAALVGLAVGAFAAGAVQVFQASRDRRLRARVAARVIEGELLLSLEVVQRIITTGRWPDSHAPDFAPLAEVWCLHRVAFAAGVNAVRWNDVWDACRQLAAVPEVCQCGEPLDAEQLRRMNRLVKCVGQGVISAGFQGYRLRELLGLQMTDAFRVRGRRYERVPRGTHGTIVRAPVTELADGNAEADPVHTATQRE